MIVARQTFADQRSAGLRTCKRGVIVVVAHMPPNKYHSSLLDNNPMTILKSPG